MSSYVNKLTGNYNFLPRLAFGLLLVITFISVERGFSQEEDNDGGQREDRGSVVAGNAKILELSVNGKSKVEAVIAWMSSSADGGKGKITVTKISRPFLFEWVEVPESATDFKVIPRIDEEIIEADNWISLKLPRAKPRATSITVSLRLDEYGKYAPIVKLPEEAGAEDSRVSFKIPHSPEEPVWVYLGAWDPKVRSWRTNYWLEDGASSAFLNRKPLAASPEGLQKEQSRLRPNIPIVPRKTPSSKSAPAHVEELLRPGTSFQIEDVRFSISASHVSVWALVVGAPSSPSSK